MVILILNNSPIQLFKASMTFNEYPKLTFFFKRPNQVFISLSELVTIPAVFTNMGFPKSVSSF